MPRNIFSSLALLPCDIHQSAAVITKGVLPESRSRTPARTTWRNMFSLLHVCLGPVYQQPAADCHLQPGSPNVAATSQTDKHNNVSASYRCFWPGPRADASVNTHHRAFAIQNVLYSSTCNHCTKYIFTNIFAASSLIHWSPRRGWSNAGKMRAHSLCMQSEKGGFLEEMKERKKEGKL